MERARPNRGGKLPGLNFRMRKQLLFDRISISASRLFGPLLLSLAGVQAFAESSQAPIIPPPPSVAASSYLLIDADTREVLVEHNARETLPPASLTKIMTGYIATVELEAGRISMDDQVPISVKAWKTPGPSPVFKSSSRARDRA